MTKKKKQQKALKKANKWIEKQQKERLTFYKNLLSQNYSITEISTDCFGPRDMCTTIKLTHEFLPKIEDRFSQENKKLFKFIRDNFNK